VFYAPPAPVLYAPPVVYRPAPVYAAPVPVPQSSVSISLHFPL